jgi:NTE family protein
MATAVLLLVAVIPAQAQESDRKDVRPRPRIGLSLGGGGARGMAHIGVLRVLEEMHVPIDYIAGTSMGAIVGSLYAIGMSPDEIEDVVIHVDWNNIFADKVNRKKRSFRRKEDDQPQFLGLEFGLTRSGFVLPRSLSEGQNLAFALPVPELHTEGRQGFDTLPIPFRAVATDVQTGEPVILDRGNLFRAVRASMTVPLAFPPIEVDGRLLVDGGFSLNDPVQVVRSMGADVVIAVSVDEFPGNRDREDLASLSEYLFQLLAVLLVPQVNESLDQADVVVHVPMPELLMDDFLRGEDAVAAGVEAAQASSDEFAALAIPETEYAAYVAGLHVEHTTQWNFDEVRVRNNSRVSDAVLLERLRPGEITSTDLQGLRRDLERIYDLGMFDTVQFEIDSEAGRNIVTVTTQEKSYAPNIFHLGAVGHATLRGDTWFTLLARLTRLEMNVWGGEWRSNAALGTNLLLDSEFYQPIGLDRHWFLSGEARVQQYRQYLYQGQSREAVQQFREAVLGADIGVPLGDIGELRSGIRWGGLQSGVLSGQSPLESFKGRVGSWETLLRYDLLDDADFPHSGGSGKLQFSNSSDALGARDTYQRLLGTWTEYFSWKRATGFWSLAGGTAFHSDLPPQEQFLLGGFGSFAGYSTDQFRGDVLGTARLGTYVVLSNPIAFIGTQWYTGGWGDLGNVWPSPHAMRLDDLRYGGALFVGADTVVGPAFLTGSLASDGGANVYLTLGLQVGVQH